MRSKRFTIGARQLKRLTLAMILFWSLLVAAANAAEPPIKFLLAYGAIGGNAIAALGAYRPAHKDRSSCSL